MLQKVQRFIVSCSDWFGGNSKMNMAIMTISTVPFCFTTAVMPQCLTNDGDQYKKSKLGFSGKFCQRYCLFLQMNQCSYIASCHCNSIISGKINSLDLKLGKPKLHKIRKIYRAVHHTILQIDQMRRYWISALIPFPLLTIKL